MKTKLNALTSEDYKSKSLSLSTQLNDLLKKFSPSGPIGGFAPLPDEPDWRANGELTERPTAYPNNGEQGMFFVQCSFESLIETKVFGATVMTPPLEKKCSPEILLVPGLAFSVKGERLGRGKGFYDRFLENFGGPKIGICFELQLQATVPTEDHDHLVDYVVTEERVIKVEKE